MSKSPRRLPARLRNLGVGLLLLSLSACGLSDYENLMKQTQEREARFREEQAYLADPIKVPRHKDKDNKEVSVADLFFRPPKGIQSAGQPVLGSNSLWRFPRRSGDFDHVELAVGEDSKEFPTEVLRNYPAAGQVQTRERRLQPLGREAQTFDGWEFDGTQYGYSVNIPRGSQPPIAIIYVFARGRQASLNKAIEISLESLALGRQASKARQKFSQQSPWQLQGGRSS